MAPLVAFNHDHDCLVAAACGHADDAGVCAVYSFFANDTLARRALLILHGQQDGALPRVSQVAMLHKTNLIALSFEDDARVLLYDVQRSDFVAFAALPAAPAVFCIRRRYVVSLAANAILVHSIGVGTAALTSAKTRREHCTLAELPLVCRFALAESTFVPHLAVPPLLSTSYVASRTPLFVVAAASPRSSVCGMRLRSSWCTSSGVERILQSSIRLPSTPTHYGFSCRAPKARCTCSIATRCPQSRIVATKRAMRRRVSSRTAAPSKAKSGNHHETIVGRAQIVRRTRHQQSKTACCRSLCRKSSSKTVQSAIRSRIFLFSLRLFHPTLLQSGRLRHFGCRLVIKSGHLGSAHASLKSITRHPITNSMNRPRNS